MLNLLTQNDQNKLKLLAFFEDHNATTLPLWQVEEVLQLSPFKTANTIMELADELRNFSGATINVGQNKQVTAYNINSELINKFKLFYLKTSSFFQLYLFFYRGENNLPLLIKEIGISQANAYNQIKSLNEQLALYDLKINNQQLSGSERIIRLKTFELLTFFYKGIESPFDENNNKMTTKIFQTIKKHSKLPKSHSIELKLKNFISTTILRIQLGSIILESNNLTLVNEQDFTSTRLYTNLITIYQQFFPKSTIADLRLEILYLIEFMISESIMTDSKILTCFSPTKRLQENTTCFLEKIKRACLSPKNFEKVELTLQQEVSASLLKFFEFNHHTDSFHNTLIDQQFTELYVIESQVITEFILTITQTNKLTKETLPLFYDLLFLLVTHIPNNSFQHPLHICVDFSRSLTYSQHIKNKINSFDALKVIFDDIVTENTDLYVSDFANYQIEAPQIIWKDPPSINDWRLFGDTLIAIRKDK